MSRTSAEALLRAQHMTQFTPHTITDLTAADARRSDLCRTDGYAIENGEYKIGPALHFRTGLYRRGQSTIHRWRDRYVPQHPFR